MHYFLPFFKKLLNKYLSDGLLTVPRKLRLPFFKSITFQNYKRLKYLSTFGIIMLSLYITGDIIVEEYRKYLYKDIFLLAGHAIALLSLYKEVATGGSSIKKSHVFVINAYAFFLINWCAYIASFEYQFQEHIYTYLMAIFIISVIFDFKTKVLLFMLASGFITHMISNHIKYDFWVAYEKGPYIFVAHVLCIFISRKIFVEKVKNFMANHQLVEKNERLNEEIQYRHEVEEELKTLTQTLEERIAQRTAELEAEITHRKSTLEALAESREILDLKNYELQNLKKEMDLFVYRTSHDIRGPISSVFGLLMLIKNTPDSQMQLLLLQKIEKSMHQIDGFIQDILEYSDNSSSPILNNKINFYGILEEVVEKIQKKYAISVDVSIEVINPKPFVSDERRLRIILKNIIDNAFMFQIAEREPKQIKIKVDTTVERNKAIIQVKDNGMGIKEEFLGKVYQMFFRATDKSKGSGLGLYITNLTVEKLNGKIEISSEPNEYTCITCYLPHQKGTISTFTNTEPERVNIFE